MGGTMRLGADPVRRHDGTRVRELYDEPVVYERRPALRGQQLSAQAA